MTADDQVIKPILKTAGGVKNKGKKNWLKARRAWFKLNPPDYKGYYYCQIIPCLFPGVPMLKNEVTLDHPISRSKRPDLVTDISLLVPAHGTCNGAKGSKANGDYKRYEARGKA